MATPRTLPFGDETLSAITADYALEVQLSYPTADALSFRYCIRNTSPLPLYLCNQLYKTLRNDPITKEVVFPVQPSLVNVQLETSRVTVGKAVVEVPERIFVEALQVPCLSRVLPGEQFAETVQVPLPLMPYTVYEYSPSRGPQVLRPLFFELGYFLASERTQGFIEEVPTLTGKTYYLDTIPVESQSMITVGPFGHPVAVVDCG